MRGLTEILGEWRTEVEMPIEAISGEINGPTKVLEKKLAKLKAQISQFEFNDIKKLQAEIQRLNEADPRVYSRLSKLNRNLTVLKYLFYYQLEIMQRLKSKLKMLKL